MGAATIVQKHISENCHKFWNNDYVPDIPQSSITDFNTNDLNYEAIKFAKIIGALFLIKTAFSGTKFLYQKLKSKHKLPTKQQLLQKYGRNSWAIITDCRENENYCTFLAKNGFNLFLLGEQDDIKIARDQVSIIGADVKIQVFPLQWKNCQANLQIYEQLLKKIQFLEISFVVLPKIQRPRELVPTHLETISPYQHIFMLVRYLAQKLRWRSYRSGLIFPSYPDTEVQTHNGISQGLIAGIDGFGRIIQFEMKQTIDVVVARGSVENAFRGLGLERITY